MYSSPHTYYYADQIKEDIVTGGEYRNQRNVEKCVQILIIKPHNGDYLEDPRIKKMTKLLCI